MPIQAVEHWEEKARLAQERAGAMNHPPAWLAMEIAHLYQRLAEQTRKLIAAGDGKK
jgi:3-deoxy-D-arabino-heptulosonate 7-phosphate (DAHP) synthase class II